MNDQTALNQEKAIVLFDGICNFCNASINFVFAHDKKDYFRFASLQSEFGQSLIKKFHLEEDDSVVLIEKGVAYTHSTAALRIARRLDGIWSWFYGLVFVPKFIRDFAYQLFARNRYFLFGKKERCTFPSPALRQRFLDLR